MYKIESFNSKLSYWLVGLSLLLPNILEPTWLWRWVCVLALSILTVYLFSQMYYLWLVKKRTPLELASESEKQIDDLTNGQKKARIILFYFGVIVAAPLLLFVSSFPLIDLYLLTFKEAEVQTADFTLIRNSTASGASIVGQSLELIDEMGNEKELYLFFSLRIQRVDQSYKITYLPYSNLVLELEPI